MMEDWTDIIGEELGTIEEPLPADDWNVLQQKYAAARRRRRAAVFAWTGGAASAAAAIALALLLVRPEGPSAQEVDLVADAHTPVEVPVDVPVQTDTAAVDESLPSVLTPVTRPTTSPRSVNSAPASSVHASIADVIVESFSDSHHAPATGHVPAGEIQVVKDAATVTERLLADAGAGEAATPTDDKAADNGFRFEDLEEEAPRRVRRPISVGLSGGGVMAGGGVNTVAFGPAYDTSPMPNTPLDDPEPPVDTTITGGSAPRGMSMRKTRGAYTDSYEHDMPVSAGVSARFMLTRRFSINTGLNYTLYSSTRERWYSATGATERERQNVHYLGIPLRCDWLIVDRQHFTFYMGVGAQVDKCIYARVGDERLHEKELLFSLTGAAGIQYNITRQIGLYLESDFSLKLNDGSLETYRNDNFGVISARAGLRFSF